MCVNNLLSTGPVYFKFVEYNHKVLHRPHYFYC
jgi:hypothetical protein